MEGSGRGKKGILIGIVICIILIIALACLVIFYQNLDATTFKLYINGVQASNSDDFYIEDESGNVYVKARELARLIGWSYQNGEYGTYTEDTNSGYIQNNYEAASFIVGSNILKKYIQVAEASTPTDENTEENAIVVNSKNGTLETMTLSLPIISLNNQIYFPLVDVNDICNCMASYENYQMRIDEMNHLADIARQKAFEYGYTSISGTYENLRALAYGIMVVNQNGRYGAVTLFSNEDILGAKYNDMVFCQNVKEFFVKAEGTIGIIAVDGTVVISPKNYDNISVLSDSLGLYLIEDNGLYGVLNRKGDVVVYAEYDSIGLPEETLLEFHSDNRYLLNDNTIVVEKDGKYGFFNLKGENRLAISHEKIGCIADETSNDDSVLTLDAKIELEDGTTGIVKGVVVGRSDLSGDMAYGVYDTVQERLIIPCGCSKIYSVTKNGVTTYYMEFEGNQYEFNSYVEEYKLYSVQ